mmetsp:Transcript_44214/g.79532  ORF Transcript_44214/g.79532 Transcript_44214/m.79532 type:complete len:100 (-) Transcript_44214:33-332(-)
MPLQNSTGHEEAVEVEVGIEMQHFQELEIRVKTLEKRLQLMGAASLVLLFVFAVFAAARIFRCRATKLGNRQGSVVSEEGLPESVLMRPGGREFVELAG